MGGVFLNKNIFRDSLTFLTTCPIESDRTGTYIVLAGTSIVTRTRYNVHVKAHPPQSHSHCWTLIVFECILGVNDYL